jgi:hypothetical protein
MPPSPEAGVIKVGAEDPVTAHKHRPDPYCHVFREELIPNGGLGISVTGTGIVCHSRILQKCLGSRNRKIGTSMVLVLVLR